MAGSGRTREQPEKGLYLYLPEELREPMCRMGITNLVQFEVGYSVIF